MYTLVGITQSPWSEKARWALDHHRIPYRHIEYMPLLGEPVLRLATGRLTGRLSVPVLFTGGEVLGDSYDIARHADQVGQGEPLCPQEAVPEVVRWNTLAEEAMGAARGLLLPRVRQSPAALEANLPPFLPRALRPLLAPAVGTVIGYLERKYRDRAGPVENQRKVMRSGLLKLREGLGGRPYLMMDRFSLADVIMATLLQGIKPVARHHLRLPRGLVEAWTDPELASEFADLLAWRDTVYDRHRRPV